MQADRESSARHAIPESAQAACGDFGMMAQLVKLSPASTGGPLRLQRPGTATSSANRKANMALILDALTPCDYSHDILRNALQGLELQQREQRAAALLDAGLVKDGKELATFVTNGAGPAHAAFASVEHNSGRRGSCTSASSSAESLVRSASAASLTSVASESSLSESGPLSEMLEHDMGEQGGVPWPKVRVTKTHTSHDKAGSRNVIFPRRKAWQDSRRSSQVVVTAEILEKHFDMPLHDAATKLGLCATAIKKACRRFGIPRWPFRERHRHTARLKHGDTEDVEPGTANDEVAGQSMDMDSGEMEASSASPESPRQSSRLLVAGANQSADCCHAAGKIKLHEGDSCPGGPGLPGGPMGVASAYPEAQP